MSSNNSARLVGLAILPKVSSVLSIMGSSALLVECLHYDRKRLERVMYRILCIVAAFDIMESIWNFASTWAMPWPDTDETIFASGNSATCTAQGFFLQLGVTNLILNTALTFYYLFVIRFSWSEDRIRKKAEPWFYSVAILWGLITSILGVPLNLYHPSGSSWCWIGDDESRENNQKFFRLAFYFIPMFACFIITAYNMFLVVWTVRSLESLSNKYLRSAYEKKAQRARKDSTQKMRRGVKKLNNVMRVAKLLKGENNNIQTKAADAGIGDEENGARPLIILTQSQRFAQLLQKQKSVARRAAENLARHQAHNTDRILELRAKKTVKNVTCAVIAESRVATPKETEEDNIKRPSTEPMEPKHSVEVTVKKSAHRISSLECSNDIDIGIGTDRLPASHDEDVQTEMNQNEPLVNNNESPDASSVGALRFPVQVKANSTIIDSGEVIDELNTPRASSVKLGDNGKNEKKNIEFSPKDKHDVFNFRNPAAKNLETLRSKVQSRKEGAHGFGNTSKMGDKRLQPSSSDVPQASPVLRGKSKKLRKSKSRQVTEQAFCYVFSFLLTFSWSVVIRFLEFGGFMKPPYWLKLGNAFFDPLQGFINYIVYIRPKYIGCRRRNPQKSRREILICLITHQELTRDEDKETEDGARKELHEWRQIQNQVDSNGTGIVHAPLNGVIENNEMGTNVAAATQPSPRRRPLFGSNCSEEEKNEIEP